MKPGSCISHSPAQVTFNLDSPITITGAPQVPSNTSVLYYQTLEMNDIWKFSKFLFVAKQKKQNQNMFHPVTGSFQTTPCSHHGYIPNLTFHK